MGIWNMPYASYEILQLHPSRPTTFPRHSFSKNTTEDSEVNLPHTQGIDRCQNVSCWLFLEDKQLGLNQGRQRFWFWRRQTHTHTHTGGGRRKEFPRCRTEMGRGSRDMTPLLQHVKEMYYGVEDRGGDVPRIIFGARAPSFFPMRVVFYAVGLRGPVEVTFVLYGCVFFPIHFFVKVFAGLSIL